MTSVARGGRARALGIGRPDPAPQPTQEMVDVARDAHAANTEKNKYTRAESRAKKTLGELMAKAGMKRFEFRVGTKVVDATYEQPESEVVDPEVLFGKVSLEDFLAVVSVSKTAAEKAFGNNVVNSCLRTARGDYRVSVKERSRR